MPGMTRDADQVQSKAAEVAPAENPGVVALVPAAGVGRRALEPGHEQPKQYRLIAGQPMLRHTVQALLAEPRVAQVHVVVSAGDPHIEYALQGLPRTYWHACGGAERHETVANGLAALDLADDAWVMVHDAARPGLPRLQLAALIDACLDDPVGGLLALPVADTLKRVADPGQALARSGATVPRDGLWQAQTPQMFRAGLLRQALMAARQAHEQPTDEASAVEALGLQPRLVPGSLMNTKVTWPQDFLWMEQWLA